MPTPGDIVEVDLGAPTGSEAGMVRPAIVVTASRVLAGGPNVIQVVPLTRTIRSSEAQVPLEPDSGNRLTANSAAQCQHVRSVAVTRVRQRVGAVAWAHIRRTLAARCCECMPTSRTADTPVARSDRPTLDLWSIDAEVQGPDECHAER